MRKAIEKAGRQKAAAVHSDSQAGVMCMGIQEGFPEEVILEQKVDPISGLPQDNHKGRRRLCLGAFEDCSRGGPQAKATWEGLMGQFWLMESGLQVRHLVGTQHSPKVPLWGRREWLGGSTAGGLSPLREVLLHGEGGCT